MEYSPDHLNKLLRLTKKNSPKEGANYSSIYNLGTFKASNPIERTPFFEIASIIVPSQGKKICHVGNKKYEFKPGNILVIFFPLPVDLEIVEASPDQPFLSTWIRIDLRRMTDILLKMDRIDNTMVNPTAKEISGIYIMQLTDRMLNPFIRLLESLEDPSDAAMLGETILDEIYYRLLRNEPEGEFRSLLEQRGDIQRISKSVEFIHQNLSKTISVDDLAKMTHMSRTTYFEKFKEVINMSPLQYAKSVKLYSAQLMIKEGKKVNEASYLVGYKSPTQFSREYKRYFGFAPSET